MLGFSLVWRLFFLSFLVVSIASCVSNDVDTKKVLCDGLFDFLSSVQPNETKVVKLVNDWGNWEQNCSHFDDPAGQRFCKVLMPNTSSEFMKLNLQSLLKCTGASLDTRNVYLSELSGDLSIFEIQGLDSDIEINLRFSIGSEDTDDFIQITSTNEPME